MKNGCYLCTPGRIGICQLHLMKMMYQSAISGKPYDVAGEQIRAQETEAMKNAETAPLNEFDS